MTDDALAWACERLLLDVLVTVVVMVLVRVLPPDVMVDVRVSVVVSVVSATTRAARARTATATRILAVWWVLKSWDRREKDFLNVIPRRTVG